MIVLKGEGLWTFLSASTSCPLLLLQPLLLIGTAAAAAAAAVAGA